MTAKQMRALGWRNATTLDASDLVQGRRHLVSNGRYAEPAVCNETLEGQMFWDSADTPIDTLLGEFSQWPWFKEDK